MDELLKNTFTQCRYFKVSRELRPAVEAIAMARQLISEGNGARYGASKPGNPYNPEFTYAGESHVRWIESTWHAGLRPVGCADEIARRHGSRSIDHQGWFTDSTFQDEVYRGTVWQLPGRNGRALYVYGYEDPSNPGAATVVFDPIKGEQLDSRWDTDDSAMEAARAADRFAERAAEKEREYRDAWQAADTWQELGSDMQQTRAAARQLVKDMRAARRSGQTAAESICNALHAQVRRLLEQWEETREKRAELADNFWYWPEKEERQSIEQFAAVHL